VLQFLHPDLYLTVLDPATPDFKPSARKYLDLANAVILHQPPVGALEAAVLWDGVSLEAIAGKPIFRVCPPDYVTEELVSFVRQKLIG
jgi:hypothetical protein